MRESIVRSSEPRWSTANDPARRRFAFLADYAWDGGAFTGQFVGDDELSSWCVPVAEALVDLAAYCVSSPYPEVKVGTAFALHEAAAAYAGLARRLDELKLRLPSRRSYDPVFHTDTTRALTAVASECLESPATAMRAAAAAADRLGDWPTVQLVEGAVAPRLDAAATLLRAVVAQLGPAADRLETMAVRDERYTTFSDAFDYRFHLEEHQGITHPGLDDSVVKQVRTNRDELDAIETFARVIACDATIDPATIELFARITADEARHALIGEIGLEELGLDPFATKVDTTGAELRAELDAWGGVGQISLIGESGNVNRIAKSAARAKDAGVTDLGGMLRTIFRDERFHIRRNVELLQAREPGSRPTVLRQRALDQTNELLARKGSPPVDFPTAALVIGE